MSEESKAKIEEAIRAHLEEENPGGCSIVTGSILVAEAADSQGTPRLYTIRLRDRPLWVYIGMAQILYDSLRGRMSQK